MNTEYIGIAVVVGVLAMTFWFSKPPSSIHGLVPIAQEKARFHGVRGDGDGDATVALSTPDGRVGNLVLLHGRLFLKPAKPGDPPVPADELALQPVDEVGKPLIGDDFTKWSDEHGFKDEKLPALHLSVTPDYYAYDRVNDFGTFAGYRPSARQTDDDTFEVGIRYSPIRLLYGTIAPDALLSRDSAGVGLSFYPPEQYVGTFFHHLGLEFGYMASLSGNSGPGYVVGLSFSTIP